MPFYDFLYIFVFGNTITAQVTCQLDCHQIGNSLVLMTRLSERGLTCKSFTSEHSQEHVILLSLLYLKNLFLAAKSGTPKMGKGKPCRSRSDV